ncbi:MAG: c-type cytochrome [SAR202 cluster bacterium]|nr:c-type cytochrome [SAR202 cluster bacterium]
MPKLVKELLAPPRWAKRLLTASAPILLLVATACAPAQPGPTATPTSTQQPPAAITPAPTATVVSTPAIQPESGPLPSLPLEQGDKSRGQKLFSSVGCIGCHTVDNVGGNVGPDLSQVASRAPERAATQGLAAPELYFVQSVVYPKAYVVQGFTPVMPNWKELQLTEKDLADIVTYLKTLK